MVVLRYQFKQPEPSDGFTWKRRCPFRLPIPNLNHWLTVKLNQPSHENHNDTNSEGNIRQRRPTQRQYTTLIHEYHRCGWFSTIHIRLRLCSVTVIRHQPPKSTPREPCYNDVCFASSSRGLDTPSRAKDTLIRAPVRGLCDASYPRVEKMGEIAYGLRSHEELEFTSFLVATTRDRWGLLCLVRQWTPSNTRNINREYRRSRCNFQSAFQGWNHFFDGILLFLHIVNPYFQHHSRHKVKITV